MTVSLGATLQIHSCGDDFLWSVLEQKSIHDSCPFCNHSQEEESKLPIPLSCATNECKDLELKLDQLVHKLFSHTKNHVSTFSPAILTLVWIQNISATQTTRGEISKPTTFYTSTNSPPPTYLFNCVFII